MRTYRVNKYKHTVYDSIDECPPNITPLKDWREAKIGDWVIADDDSVIQILRKGKMMRKKSIRYYIGTCTGTFLVLPNTIMDTDRRPNIYSFGGYGTPEEVVKNRKHLTANEEIFVKNLMLHKEAPEEAYVNAFPTNNKRYARVKAANLIKTERIKTAMKEELKPIMEELGIDPKGVLEGIKILAQTAQKDDTKLKALFKLSDILDLEDKTKTSVQQVSGAVFQGFSKEQLKSVERKELSDGK